MEQLFIGVCLWAVTGVAGYLVAKLSDLKRKHEEQEAVEDTKTDALCVGVRSLLRNELVKAHRDTTTRGGCSLLEKEIAERNYNAYHDLGGNGTGTAMFAQIMDAPIVDDQRR